MTVHIVAGKEVFIHKSRKEILILRNFLLCSEIICYILVAAISLSAEECTFLSHDWEKEIRRVRPVKAGPESSAENTAGGRSRQDLKRW